MFSFPNPVNEKAARVVAGTVLTVDWAWAGGLFLGLLVPLAYGFWARVLTGPTLSPLGQLATRVITPALRLPARLVPGPPKRFAQGIGALLSVSAAVLALGFGQRPAASVLLGLVTVAATLESVFGYCIGCKIFGWLMRIGVVPESTCEQCNDIWSRRRATYTTPVS